MKKKKIEKKKSKYTQNKTKKKMKSIFLVTACSKNNVIGQDGAIPWSLPDELKHFRKLTTMGETKNSIVMGRRTFDSLDRKVLPQRFNIVITKDKIKYTQKDENLIFVSTLEEVFEEHEKRNLHHMFVIGGNDIYKLFLEKNLIEKIYFTHVKQTIEGGKLTYFPKGDFWLNFSIESVDQSHTEDYDIIVYKKMTNKQNKSCELQYNNLVQTVLNKEDLSSFGNSMKFDLQEGFPLLTGKRMYFKGIVEELLWFLSGKTDSKILKEKGVNIWEKNSTREYLDSVGLKKNKEYDLGPVYGHNFRHYGAEYENCDTDYNGKGVDQIQYVLNMIRTNPSSRRIIINLWNPCQINEVALPPCHVLYHFKVDETKKTLSCILYQRSGDVALGVPFNIASASLLTHIIAFLTDLKVGVLTHFIGDAHIYKEHREGMTQQLDRYLYPFPKLEIRKRNQMKVEEFCFQDFNLQGYVSNTTLAFPLIV